jgi:hypothetical protein
MDNRPVVHGIMLIGGIFEKTRIVLTAREKPRLTA